MPSRSRVAVRVVLWLAVVALVGITVTTLYRTGAFTPPARIALVASDESHYWDDAIAGARDAAEQYGAVPSVHQASGGEPDQSRILREVAAGGVDGIAVSPLHASRQAAMLLEIGSMTDVVTFDSDSPRSGRLCFVGTNNYTAGRACGLLVREAMPEGGTVVISVGSLDKENGRLRRQGVIDELLERSFGPGRPADPLGTPLVGPDYTIIRTLVDDMDPEESKQKFADLLADGELPGCIVGLYAYSAPAAVDALMEAGVSDEVIVVGFDYTDETLDAIEAGQIYASMAQDPYSYGFRAVQILAKQQLRKTSVGSIPTSGIVEIPYTVIRRDDLAAFRARLAKQRSGEPS